jgi:hypothetical protein
MLSGSMWGSVDFWVSQSALTHSAASANLALAMPGHGQMVVLIISVFWSSYILERHLF